MQSSKHLTIVVFGVTGELYLNKLSQALFNLFLAGDLPKDFSLVGFARKPLTDSNFQKLTKSAIGKKNSNINKQKLNKFLSRLKYVSGDLGSPASFQQLSKILAEEDMKRKNCSSKLFYLAVPPTLYASTFKNLHQAGLDIPCASGVGGKAEMWTRILVEKPFGRSLEEAKRLDKMLSKLFDPAQIFCVDHYIMKDMMQNLLALHFKNKNFESVASRKNVKKVRIVFHEKNTPEDSLSKRGAFYDKVGALRDVGQSHMLQMLAVFGMSKPKKHSAEAIQGARGEVLSKTSLFNKSKNILLHAQYKGYLKERGVDPHSKTETFFRVVLGVNTPKWRGVPFELESGKALREEEMSIELFFKNADERLKFLIFSKNKIPHLAHEKVFSDAILGDRTSFVSSGEIMAQWRIVESIIKKWKNIPIIIYKKGSKPEVL